MARDRGDEGFTPGKLRAELDEIAGLADALEIVVGAHEDDRDRSERAIGALAAQISRRVDALYIEIHEALDDPKSFLGRKGRG